MPGEGGVPAPGLEAEPALVLVLPDPHVLPRLAGPLPQPLAQGRPALVQGRLLVFVLRDKSVMIIHNRLSVSPHLNCNQSPGTDEVLGDVSVAPEAGVVEGGVTVLINKVHICLVSEKLKERHGSSGHGQLSVVTPTHRVHHLPVSVRGPQVQGRVVPHVGCVHARPPPYQHLQDLQVTPLGRPVQRRELVVISKKCVMLFLGKS